MTTDDRKQDLIDILVEKPQHKISSNSQGGYDCRCGARWDWQKSEREDAERHAAGYLADRLLAVFEAAQKPTAHRVTTDEREALANLIPLGFTDRDPVQNVFQAADRILAAGFRRPVSPEGRRWFTAAYRAQNGNVIQIGDETVIREHAQETVDEFTEEDDEGPEYFVATLILPPWMPVEQEGENR